MIEIGLGILVFLIAGAGVALMIIALNADRRLEAADHDSCFGQSGSPSSTG